MPRVRAHTRRDGTRVRSHHRRGRRRGAVVRRSTPRSVRRRSRRSAAPFDWRLLAVAPLLLVVVAVVRFVRHHPYWSLAILLTLVGLGLAAARLVLRDRARRQAEQAARDRLVEGTDLMSGPEFEQWLARLLARSGFSRVQVRGGAGDRGADVVAVAPDGRRVVVQCKRHRPENRIGSAMIQQFAGTCRAVHGGELCLIVTNGFFADGDGRRLAQQLGILLVDRTTLGRWAHTGVPPDALTSRGTGRPGGAGTDFLGPESRQGGDRQF